MAIRKVVDEFGAPLWLDQELQLSRYLKEIFMATQQNGFVTVTSSMDFRHTPLVAVV